VLINDINSRLSEINAELEVLASLTDVTEDDAARSEALLLEGEELKQSRIEAQERAERIRDAHAKAKAEDNVVRGSGTFQHMQKVDAYATDTRTMNTDEVRDAARSILDRPEARHIDAAGKEKAEALISNLDSRLGRWTISSSRPEYRSAFGKYITGRENLMTNDERRAVEMVDYEARTFLALADANGGYAVPALLDPSIIYTGNGTVNPMRQVSRIVTGMDDTWRGVSSAGVTASWDGEGVEVSDDTPTFGQPTVTAYKGQAFAGFSVEIEGDWSGLAGEVGELFAIAKDDLETAAFATGSGSQPQGIITALVAGSGTVSNVAPGTDGALFAADIRGLFAALPPRYRTNASWMMSIDAQNEVRGLGDDKLGNQTVDLKAGYDFQVLGKPVYENSGFPDFTGTTGVANIMVVGDFRNFVIFDRVGSRVELIPHLLHTTTNLPKGQRGLVYWFRTGSDSVNDNAFRLLRNT
jgi:HK97 family phage major capsid protein